MGLLGPDMENLFHFLSICILAFINEGSSSLSSVLMNEPWSWGLGIPFSLYLKFVLELHAHLGICVGVGLPSLVYWGVTRSSIDWYWNTVLKFNLGFLKTGFFNLVIGLLHFLVSKLVHRIIQWVKDHKVKGLSSWPVISKLESSIFFEHPLLKPIPAKDDYSYEVGKGISWVSLGSSMFVGIKALLEQLEIPQAPPEEKEYKVENYQYFSNQSMGSKEQATCS